MAINIFNNNINLKNKIILQPVRNAIKRSRRRSQRCVLDLNIYVGFIIEVSNCYVSIMRKNHDDITRSSIIPFCTLSYRHSTLD